MPAETHERHPEELYASKIGSLLGKILIKYLGGISEEVPALPAAGSHRYLESGGPDRIVVSTPRVCGAKHGMGNKECDLD